MVLSLLDKNAGMLRVKNNWPWRKLKKVEKREKMPSKKAAKKKRKKMTYKKRKEKKAK